MTSRTRHAPALILALLTGVRAAGAQPSADARCQARSGTQQVALVELYTSEGCSSCPPADRWLSSLRQRPDVLAAAFHVDYWDTLGWPDRFAQPAFTARQQALQRSSGARFVYTPQVLVNGRDWRAWPSLPVPTGPARVQVLAQRLAGGQVQVRLIALGGAPGTLGLWWAVLEDGHLSAVKAGENRGVLLRHDRVVRLRVDEAAWAGAVPGATHDWWLSAPRPADTGHAARLLLVVTDPVTASPVQVLQLDC